MRQNVYKNGEQFFLVDIYDDGTVTLKIKEEGWHDTWSLPLEEVTR